MSRPSDGRETRVCVAQIGAAHGLRAPVPFFPRSAWTFVEEGGDFGKARVAWAGTGALEGPRAERDDAAYRIALRGRPDPLEHDPDAFERLAYRVYGPLLDHLATTAASTPS